MEYLQSLRWRTIEYSEWEITPYLKNFYSDVEEFIVDFECSDVYFLQDGRVQVNYNQSVEKG